MNEVLLYEFPKGQKLYKNQVVEVRGIPHLDEGELGGELRNGLTFITKEVNIDPSTVKRVKIIEPISNDMVLVQPFDKQQTFEELIEETDYNNVRKLTDKNILHMPSLRIEKLEKLAGQIYYAKEHGDSIPFENFNSKNWFNKKLEAKNIELEISKALEHYKEEERYLQSLDKRLTVNLAIKPKEKEEFYNLIIPGFNRDKHAEELFKSQLEDENVFGNAWYLDNKVLAYWSLFKDQDINIPVPNGKKRIIGSQYMFSYAKKENLPDMPDGNFFDYYILLNNFATLKKIEKKAYILFQDPIRPYNFPNVILSIIGEVGFTGYIQKGKHPITGREIKQTLFVKEF
jgi:hypothetical protein